MLTFIMGCFRSSCNTEEARVFSSCHRERRLMTSANERKRSSFVPPNHRVWFGSKSAIGPRTRLCDTYELFNYWQHVSLNYLAPAGALKGGKMSKKALLWSFPKIHPCPRWESYFIWDHVHLECQIQQQFCQKFPFLGNFSMSLFWDTNDVLI